MSGIHTEIVGARHAYTREDIPWQMSGHNLLRAYGRSVADEKRVRRQRRFFVAAGVFWTVWMILYLI